MTPNDAIAAVKAQLKNWQGSDLDDWIVNEMNAAVRRLERWPELPWFLLKDTEVEGTNLSTVANTETVALPSDFLRLDYMRDFCLYRKDTSQDDVWVGLVKSDYSRFKQHYEETGEPTRYDMVGKKLYLRKIPNTVYTLRLFYFSADDEIAAGTAETTWLAERPDLIIAEAGAVISAQYVGDQAAAQLFNIRRQEERELLRAEIITKYEDQTIPVMGEEN